MEVEAWNAAASSQPAEQGSALQKLLLGNGSVPKVFHEAIGRAYNKSGDRLHVVLRIDKNASELHALNWEFLPLARDERTPFTRFYDLTTPANPPLDARPLKMVVAIASPSDLEQKGLADIPMDKAIQTIWDAVESLVAKGNLEVTLLPGQKGLDELDADLRANLEKPDSGWTIVQGFTTKDNVLSLMDQCHIFHFLGHGGFINPEARIFLETETGITDETVTDTFLCGRLMPAPAARKPYLIFLSACESGKRDAETDQAFMGLGPKLIESGVPAVVAMQNVVELFPMLALSKLFYERLLEDGMVDLALNHARRLLYDEKSAVWAPPVLYGRLREDGGLIFKAFKPVNDAAQATNEIVPTLSNGEPESDQIRAELLGLMEELTKTHRTIQAKEHLLRQIDENEATFANDFRKVYDNWREFYDGPRLRDERTHCSKVRVIKQQLERHPVTQTPEWDLLRRNLDTLSSFDDDVIERHYVPFMKRFNEVMIKINRHVKSKRIRQAMTLMQVFLDGLAPQYEDINEKLTLMDKTIADINLSL